MKENKSLLVLFSRKNRQKPAYERIFSILRDTAKQQGRSLDFKLGTLDELWIEIRNNVLVVTDPVSSKELKEFDFVDFNWWGRAKQQALAVATYLKSHNVPFLTAELADLPVGDKIGEMAKMANRGIALPDTFMSSNHQIARAFRSNPPISFPVIMKDAGAYGGNNNYLVNDYTAMLKILDNKPDIDFLVQEFIPNDCDYRCLVLGGEIKLVLRRSRGDNADTHVNNTSSGGSGVVVDIESISQRAKDMVLEAAQSMNRIQFSGVDLIINTDTGEPYILEVNQTPEIEEGAEPQKKMEAFFDYVEGVL